MSGAKHGEGVRGTVPAGAAKPAPMIVEEHEWPKDVAQAMAKAHAQAEAAKKRLAEAQAAAQEANQALMRFTGIEKALKHHENSVAPLPKPPGAPSAEKRQPNEAVEGQVKALIVSDILDNDETWSQTAKKYKVSRSTIARVMRDEKAARGEAQPWPTAQKRGRKSAFDGPGLVWLCDHVDRNPGDTLDQIRKAAEEAKIFPDGQCPGISTFNKTLNDLSITWKTSLEIPETYNAPETIQKRQDFVAAVRDLLIDPLREVVYIDEQGYDLKSAKAKKGRALAGRPARLVLKPKGRRVSVIAALSRDGIIHTQLVEALGPAKRGTTGDDFRLFMHDARPVLRGKVVIMDTAKIHDTKELAQLWPELKERDNIDVVFLPPYSSFLDAIEYAFHKMKVTVQHDGPQNHKELKEMILAAVKTVTKDDAAHFLQQAHSYWRQAALGIPFHGKILGPEHAALEPPAAGAQSHSAHAHA